MATNKSILYDIAEKQVIVALLKAKSDKAKLKILKAFKPEYFADPRLRQIFTRCRYQYEWDRVLPKMGDLLYDHALDADTKRYLRAMMTQKSLLIQIKKNKAKLSTIQKFLRKEAMRRKVADFVRSVKNNYLEDDDADVSVVMKEASQLITELGDEMSDDSSVLRLSAEKKDLKKLNKVVHETFKQQKHNLVKTGLDYFDKRSGGLPRGHISILAATTGGGKSTLALCMAFNQFRKGYKVAYVSLEMEQDELILRMISRYFKVPFVELYKGDVPKKKLAKMRRTFISKVQRFSMEKGNFLDIITPSKSQNIHELLLELRRDKYDAIYIDYINLLEDLDPKRSQWENMSNAARYAKIFAKGAKGDKMKDKPHIVILAQFDGKRGEIRYSKGIVEHASLFWAWVYDDKAKMTHVLELRQLKTRNQPQYNFTLKERFDICSIEGMTYEEFQAYNVTHGAFTSFASFTPADTPPGEDGAQQPDKKQGLAARFKQEIKKAA